MRPRSRRRGGRGRGGGGGGGRGGGGGGGRGGRGGIHPASVSNITMVPAVNSLQLVTEAVNDSSDHKSFETFNDHVNQRQWSVPVQ
jgi:hypothetical protein